MLRVVSIVGLAACGGTTASTTPVKAPVPVTPASAATRPAVVEDTPPVDPIAALAPDEKNVTSMIPGRIQLELGAAAIEAPGGNKPIDHVTVIDEQAGHVRVAIRLPHARFSVWTTRMSLMPAIKHALRVSQFAGGGAAVGDMHATLRPGAKVLKLASKNKWTQIRYHGSLQIEGWVPDDSLAHDTAARATARTFHSAHIQGVTVGAIIRVEPRWGSRELAVLVRPYSLKRVRDVDKVWVEVTYDDADIQLRGFVQKNAPPGAVKAPTNPETPPPKVTTNQLAPSGTCLHAHADGEAIGYLVGDQQVALDDAGHGWWNLAVDTPWGPLTFSARGTSQEVLVACAPDGSVPKPKPPAPSVP